MNYIALYRKYRPQKFQDFVGQSIVVRTLKNAIKYKKINHCYLFSGDKGVGKSTLAKIFAKSINCHHFLEKEDCCKKNDDNYCRICADIDQGKILDIIEIDGASHSSIYEIKDLKDKLSYKPNFLKYKIYIIDEIHVLTANAFNALLKIAEEPPDHVILIFITSELNKIPKSFISRTQYFYLNYISDEDIKYKLRSISEHENIQISEKTLEKISFYSYGSLRDSLNLLDQLHSYNIEKKIHEQDIYEILNIVPEEKIKELFYHLFQKDISHLISFLEDILTPKINLVNFCNDVISFFQKIVIDDFKESHLKSSFLDKFNPLEKEQILDQLLKLQNYLSSTKQKKNLLFFSFIQINEILKTKKYLPNHSISQKYKFVGSSFDMNKSNNQKNIPLVNNLENNFSAVNFSKEKKTTFKKDFLLNIVNILMFSNDKKKDFLQKGWKILKNYHNPDLRNLARLLFNSKLLLINNNKEILLSCKSEIEYRQFLINSNRIKIKNILNTKYPLINEYYVILEKDWTEIIEPVYLKFLQTKNQTDLNLDHFQTDFYEKNSVLSIEKNFSANLKLALDIFDYKKIVLVDD
ncbi:MAG: DNA polymerase III subunit gamma/tau [Candidatus Phytoplasma stylosanthis]|uniref:DNA polymerase III subunit gamma/tau n=1 Tax=Candidatus Phytoplasma stylosanthis TaxID=2798314 RepID=UPI002939DCC4|nr:DNA polymerase III subunit gamma/tau [Candidatus Phytoplasma stylosanthis]MDV3168113.1 DNA polymerase III subunit gamma/tau [Candidatus Phytoplasma stylosanthis]MDV3170988.1 DNA polymerase III subunit gamma/tau [Candidatus Phytoplasma stylosanthis]MDV3173771.1 DNA polymerase III subunit gamma/tau [Candidatus Phytoplasma stylosanthis]MDV3174304.1 DNA polymerase III subunit gamma/tau [Candidatus Phytoplasma stylosanthis]